jgi:hypothetical protein
MKIDSKLLASAILLVACSSETPAAPSRPPIPPPATIPDGGEGTGDGGTQANCFDAAAAKPTEPGQFLNQCNGTGCFKFDTAQIEGWKPGSPLPPLN